MTKDKPKLPVLSAAQQAAFRKLALPPVQREAFVRMAAHDQAMAPALTSGKPQGAASKPQADLAGKPQQAIVAEAVHDMRDTAVMTIAAVHRRVVDWVVERNEGKPTGEKIAIPSRTSVARFLGRRKD